MPDDPLLRSPVHVRALKDLGTARGMIEVMRAALEKVASARPECEARTAKARIDELTRLALRVKGCAGTALRRVREIEAADKKETRDEDLV